MPKNEIDLENVKRIEIDLAEAESNLKDLREKLKNEKFKALADCGWRKWYFSNNQYAFHRTHSDHRGERVEVILSADDAISYQLDFLEDDVPF